ncbi:MAG TPA: glycosyltransferase family 2 protein [Thermoanaerobaculia bacterium]|nr:glycosyltransferase family 2 protein [Thermoanaerobaculia bacterium]
MSLLAGAAAFFGALLLAAALRTHYYRWAAPRLGPATEGEPTTVLLPVRNEESNVAECLATLLAQTASPRVRVIDDSSTDRTAEIVREIQAREPRLELVEAGELPPGWRGKVHALEVGSQGVETPWILSTDADTRHHPELLARVHATVRERQLDALSIAGFQEARGLGENLLTPAVFALLDALLGDWRRVASGESTLANGQFILVRRAALEAIGGFEAIRNKPLDDVALAIQLREKGIRNGFLRAPEMLRVRMYRGLGEAFRGWRRNLGGLSRGRPGQLAVLLGLLLVPPILLLLAIARGDWTAAAVAWVSGTAASVLFRSSSSHTVWTGLLYPVDSVLLAACLGLGWSDYRRGRLASWKGREMPLG